MTNTEQTGAQKLQAFKEKTIQEKKITKINERIYYFTGYGHSNATAVVGDTSVILIDTLDSDARAERLKADLKTITEKPVETIIYTHSHPDHRGGAGVFADTVKEVIAYRAAKPTLKYYDRIQETLNKRGTWQFGYQLTDEEVITQGLGMREGFAVGDGKRAFLKPTTEYCMETVMRTIDGVQLELFAAPGETDDQLGVWLPEDQVLCCGDNYYACWPNLYAIRGTQYRDVAAWIEALDKIRSYPANVVLPGHTEALMGKERAHEVLTAFRNALESILFQTLDCLNQGLTLEETVQAVKLPQEYADLDFLGEYYGTVEWSVKSIYNGYVGWFDGDPVSLLPVPRKEYNEALFALIGDKGKILEQVKNCRKEGQYQLGLQLLQFLTKCDEAASEAEILEYRCLRAELLLGRAEEMTSSNARHYLIAAAKEEA